MTSLPTGWALATIGDVTQPVEVVDWTLWPGPTFTYVDISSIDNSTLTIASARTLPVAEAPSRARQVMRAGDTVFSTVRTYLRNIGYVTDNLDGQIASTGFVVLRPIEGVASRFLYYYVQYPGFIRDVSAQQRGVSYPAVTAAQVRAMPIPVPPLAEQEGIVAAIEEKFSRIDVGAALLNSARRKNRVLELAVLSEAFSGRVPPVGMPRSGWTAVRLDSIAEVKLGRQRSPKNHHGANMVPYLRAANVTWSGFDLSDVKEMNFSPSEVSTFRLARNDILLSEASGSANEVGKPAMWGEEIPDCCFQNTLLRVRANSAEPRYLFWYFKWLAMSQAFAKRSRGVGIHHLGAAALSEWMVPLAPRDQQERIVEAIEAAFGGLGVTSRTIHAVADKAEHGLRTAILIAAFSGDLSVQDSSREITARLETPEVEEAGSRSLPARAEIEVKEVGR